MSMTPSERGASVARQIAGEIRAEMARQGMSQQALADRIGVGQPYISRRLAPDATVAVDVVDLVRIAEALNVTPQKFLPVEVAA